MDRKIKLKENMCLIDIISDIHIDSHLNGGNSIAEVVRDVLKPKSAELLIIAGDLSSNTKSGIKLIEELLSYYNKIVFVLGNHDLYSFTMDYKELIKEYKKWTNKFNTKEDKVVLLTEDVIEYNGFRIGGLTYWYNADTEEKLNLWKTYINDNRYIQGFDTVKFYQEQKNILKKMKNLDVLVTHVSPVKLSKSWDPIGISDEMKQRFRRLDFCFENDDLDLVKSTKAKYLIYGHTHEPQNYVEQTKDSSYSIRCICNPLGYSGYQRTEIKQFLLQK